MDLTNSTPDWDEEVCIFCLFRSYLNLKLISLDNTSRCNTLRTVTCFATTGSETRVRVKAEA